MNRTMAYLKPLLYKIKLTRTVKVWTELGKINIMFGRKNKW